MILLADVGNTRIKWGLLANGVISSHQHAVWHGLAFKAVLESYWSEIPRPDRIVVANVAEAATASLKQWTQSIWQVAPEFTTVAARAYGLNNGYHNPSQLGVDRWMAVVGAWHAVHDTVCVVDCGTAITIDVVTAEGEYRGGLIAPGMDLMRSALTDRSPALVEDGDWADGVLALTTEQAIAAGALNATVGLIERSVSTLNEELGSGFRCFITGGDAAATMQHLRGTWEHYPDLVLQGLAIAAEDGT
jgi:type III pantothenate kinase